MKSIENARRRVFELLEPAGTGMIASRICDVFILSLIVLNTVAVILESVPGLTDEYAATLAWFETVSLVIFTVEYVLRLWSCTADERFARPITGRIRHAVTPMAVVDLVAILPFYLPSILPIDLRFVRMLRLLRVLRVLKIARYSKALARLGLVLRRKKAELVVSVFVISILLLLASSMAYIAEREAQPELFTSIPAAMWWGVATLTTVGYGDIFPVTPAGKVIAAFVAVLGVGLFAVPAGIIASGFGEIVEKAGPRKWVCPHCGKESDVSLPEENP